MPIGWQASFHQGVRGRKRGKSCSLRDLAILLRNRFEINVYGIEPRDSTETDEF